MEPMDVKDELVCPVCLELYNVPIILPCSHILCQQCSVQLFVSNFIKCPMCRDNSYVTGGVDSLPRVKAIENIIERYKRSASFEEEFSLDTERPDSPTVNCQMCSGPPRRASRTCRDCNASYCSTCLGISHPNRPPFTEHTLVDPLEVPKQKLVKCVDHGERAEGYCMDCLKLTCHRCEEVGIHSSHPVSSLESAYIAVRGTILEKVKQLEETQEFLTDGSKQLEQVLEDIQRNVERRRRMIGAECDSLILEVEERRKFFLTDLECEWVTKHHSLDETKIQCRQNVVSVLHLLEYAHSTLSEGDPATFLRGSNKFKDRLQKGLNGIGDLPIPPPDVAEVKTRVVDFRKERAILRELQYLQGPCLPGIRVDKCCRSTDYMILEIYTEGGTDDVIDTYKLLVSSQEGTTQKEQSYRNARVEKKSFSRGTACEKTTAIIVSCLQPNKVYRFDIKVANAAGESKMSEPVFLETSLDPDLSIPIPIIDKDLSRTFSTSIQVFCSTPSLNATKDVDYYLLCRELDEIMPPRVRKCKPMTRHGTTDHRMFGLEPNTRYEFIVLAVGVNRCAQVSEPVPLKTNEGV